MHAEEFILKHLQEKLYAYRSYKYMNFDSREDEFKRNLHKVKAASGFFNLKMYASYSPCSDCSQKLLDFVNSFSGDVDVCVENIFDTFYKHQDENHWLGLVKLCDDKQRNTLNHEIQLKTLNRICDPNTWTMFLQDMGVKGTNTTEMWRNIITKPGRQKREELDDYV